jgi:hypothetical protein
VTRRQGEWVLLIRGTELPGFRCAWGAYVWGRAMAGGEQAEREERERREALTTCAGRC